MTGNAGTKGNLILAGNSIGQLADIPPRALDALKSSNLLIFEEDRPARAALKAAGIHRDYLKLNEHDSRETLEIVRKALIDGQTVCYMSDQGMPNVADPGQQLNDIAEQLQARRTVIPGPSSITAALAAFPEKYHEFHYAGFLPRDHTGRERRLKESAEMGIPVIMMEAPYRRQALVDAIHKVCSPKSKLLLAIDISGDNEQYIFGPVARVRAESNLLKGKLNFVAILRGSL